MLNIKYYFALMSLCLFASSINATAAQEVTFPSKSTYSGKPVTLTGDLSLPKTSGRHPIAILLHGCGGLGSAVKSSLRKHARALNQSGFATLILDSFGPRGISGGWVCDRFDRLSGARHYRQKDVKDAIRFLASNQSIDINNVFLMGQSNGGSVVAIMAGRNGTKGLRAAAAYYPWCGIIRKKSARPLLVLSGEADDWTPPHECKLRHKPSDNITVKTYPGATHSFDLNIPKSTYKGHVLKGDRAATAESRRRMIKFFKSHLKN